MISENFPNMKNRTPDPGGTVAPNKINPRSSTARHIVIKNGKGGDKDRI